MYEVGEKMKRSIRREVSYLRQIVYAFSEYLLKYMKKVFAQIVDYITI